MRPFVREGAFFITRPDNADPDRRLDPQKKKFGVDKIKMMLKFVYYLYGSFITAPYPTDTL